MLTLRSECQGRRSHEIRPPPQAKRRSRHRVRLGLHHLFCTTTARTELARQLAWLPGALDFNATSDSTITYVAGVLTVTIHYPTSKLNQALPFLVLPGIGSVPRLPATLSASSSLQF